MKLTEMSPATNPVHKAFADAAAEFQQTEPWRKLIDTHFKVEHEGQTEFRYFKYVRDKLQLFREYGDVLQSERSKDVATYAAPEGQLELEIRPERLEKDKPKEPRPRINVYMPKMTPIKDGEQGYTHRIATEEEIKVLTLCIRAGQLLYEQHASLPTRSAVGRHEMLEEENVLPVTHYDAFTKRVTVSSPPQGGDALDVVISTPCSLSATVKKCAYCSRQRDEMPRCAGCKVTYYCSPEHQKSDWKQGHKRACAQRAKEAAEAAEVEARDDMECLPSFAQNEHRLNHYTPPLPIEEFHSQNEATIPPAHLLKAEPVWECGAAPVLPEAAPAAPLTTWREVYEALSLSFPDQPQHGVPLTQPLTLYYILSSLLAGHASMKGRSVVTVHLVDASLEVPMLESFGVLASLLPADFPRLRFVVIGRRVDRALHYRVVSWATKQTLMYTEAEPTGVMGDVWRGADDHQTAVRFFCDDYTTFTRKTDKRHVEADVVVHLNCIGARHSFFHNTTHICAQKLATTPVFLCCYTKFEAEGVLGAFQEVIQKEKNQAPLGPARIALPNPFRCPMRSLADSPLPCYANAFITAWY